jgi:hypothetical protein
LTVEKQTFMQPPGPRTPNLVDVTNVVATLHGANYTASVTRVNLASLAALANGPAAPQGVKVEAATLTVDTTLEWQPNTEPDLAGYEIVYRDTTKPFWSNVIPVGHVTSYTVKGITKDNCLFGVRAVDRDGNRSVVTFPVPK